MNNFERFNQINAFLEECYKNILDKSNYINSGKLYRLITRYGIPLEEQNFDVKDIFPKWVGHYENTEKLGVFVAPRGRYFCQFVSRDDDEYRRMMQKGNPIKLYISLDSSHIYEGVKKIFDFIKRNNIVHLSKVAGSIRCDDVVIRVETKKDAQKIINFVKNDKYLQEGIKKKTNPFVPNEYGVAYTCDGSLSFNGIVSALVYRYLNDKKMKYDYSRPNVNELYKYVYNIQERMFGSKSSPDELLAFWDVYPYKKGNDVTEEELYGLKICLNLLLKSLNTNFSINDFYRFYENTENVQDYYYDSNAIENTLREELSILIKKKNFDSAICNIEKYISTGNLNYISKENGFREKFRKIQFDKRLNDYLRGSGLSCRELCCKVMGRELSKTDEVASKVKFIYDIMVKKHGSDFAYSAICSYLKTGMSTNLTRAYGVRNFIVNSDLRIQVQKFIKANCISVEDFVNKVINRVILNDDYLEKACMLTYLKYDKLYSQGEVDIDGLDWTSKAIKQVLSHNNYGGFTRDHGIREQLSENVSANEILSIVSSKLGMDEKDILECDSQELNEICKKYVCSVVGVDSKGKNNHS